MTIKKIAPSPVKPSRKRSPLRGAGFADSGIDGFGGSMASRI
jgi:hypothetical protein